MQKVNELVSELKSTILIRLYCETLLGRVLKGNNTKKQYAKKQHAKKHRQKATFKKSNSTIWTVFTKTRCVTKYSRHTGVNP